MSSSMATKETPRPSVRERLLEAASELFYEEGVNTVGIDRVIERAGVAKASLYNTFGSKEELIRSYLEARHEARRARIEHGLARFKTPRDKLLGVFDLLGDIVADPRFRGCAFMRASAEAKDGGLVQAAVERARAWMRELLVSLARDAGAAHPERLGQQLAVIYDGATVSGQLERDPRVAREAKAMAATLLDADLTTKGVRRSSGRRSAGAR
jgi:AcrR family transcriptional regulator